MSRRLSSDSLKSTSSGTTRRSTKLSKADVGGTFNWDKYLQQTGMPAAPPECFKQQALDDILDNKFKVYDKLEAKDARNPSAISVAHVVLIQGPRLCLRLDGTDGCNDFWRMIDSKDIFPLGTCEAHGGLLQPPLGFTRNVSTWPGFLQRTLRDASQAQTDYFLEEPENPESNKFEIGMKLEAVDRKNPQLICPATIGDVDGDQVFISFDGWRGAFDYWSNYTSRDLFPVGWCQKNDHVLQCLGQKGENPVVMEKLKMAAEQRKRQTRSVKNQIGSKSTVKDVLSQTKEKPVRRRRVNSIKAAPSDEKPLELPTPEEQGSPAANTTSDSSASSDESDSSQEDVREKKQKLETEDENKHSLTEAQSSFTASKDGHTQFSDQTLKKLERRVRKQKRKQRRLAKALKRAGLAEGDENGPVSLNLTPEQLALLASPKFKKKKKKRKVEASYTRLEGFGLKGNEQTVSTASATSPTSPFLDVFSSPPTSLFGVDKSRIVREATQGWPKRLLIGSVVTSDNKLGRFDKTPQDKSKGNADDKILNEPAVPILQCVSTTNEVSLNDISPTDAERATPSPFVTSTTHSANDSKKDTSEDTNTVSSTTNPSAVNPLPGSGAESSTLSQAHSSKVSSTVSTTQSSERRRSRNPARWSIQDVMNYVKEKEPALHQHIGIFQKHEIDGGAFLLLNSNNIVKYMALKLGPALKLCSLVEDLKATISKHSRQKLKK
ncbi:unnamed protein product [Clavelina lepadiformis]|uniref:SAM domain-containing protein n=1 Tax=Clavelina lepadiformis TaxID=159417 RepID=A0ABP0FTT0_CLALP